MIEGVPSRLFKYLRPEHAQSLLCRGDVRVGTLFEFREIEDAERGDPGEGMLRTAFVGGSADLQQHGGNCHQCFAG